MRNRKDKRKGRQNQRQEVDPLECLVTRRGSIMTGSQSFSSIGSGKKIKPKEELLWVIDPT